ncbi:hypothetical protein ACOMHN_064792 [Nucella lapillus]
MCGICRHKFTSTSTCCDHMKVHSRTRSANSSSTHPKTSSEVMSASPVPHFSPPGSPLPKRPQTALASAFRKYPTSLKPLKRSMSEPPSAEKGKLISPSLGHGDVLAWQPDPLPAPEKGFVCYYCQREFPEALSLTRHSRTHGSAKPYSCSYCGKMFSLYSSLVIHEKSHESELPPTFRCRTCGTVFLHEATLKAHERRHKKPGGRERPEARPYQCTTCHEWVSTEVLLKIHMQRHEGFQTPRVCTLCGTTFSCETFLRAHNKLHEGEATMRCVICMRHFRRSLVLLRHSDVQAEERQNVCDSCEKRFPKVADGSWRRMKLLGKGERQFQCLYCGADFSRLHQLAAHEACHREMPLHPLTTASAAGKPPSQLLYLPSVVVN